MKSLKSSVKHAKYVLGSLSAVLFAACQLRHLLTGPAGGEDPGRPASRVGAAPWVPAAPAERTAPARAPDRKRNRDVRHRREAIPDGDGHGLGTPLSPRNMARLVDDVIATIAEFGEPGEEAQEVLGGPLADPRNGWSGPIAAEPHRPQAGRQVAVLRAPVRRRAGRSGQTRRRGAAGDPGHHQAGPDRAAARLPLQRRAGLPGHPHHRHHRPPGGGVAVPLRDGAVARAGRAVLGSARRPAARRRHAGQRQLPRDRGRRTWPPPPAAWPAPDAACWASCRRTRRSTASARAGRRCC